MPIVTTVLSGVVSGGANAIIPIAAKVTRQLEWLTIGSSSFGATGSTATTAINGTTVPAEFVGVSIQGRLRTTTLPDDGSRPTIENVQGAGGYGVTPIGIRDGVRQEFNAGRTAGFGMLVQYGGNMREDAGGDKEVLDCCIDSDTLLAANRLVIAQAYFPNGRQIQRVRANRRIQKFYQQTKTGAVRMHGFYDMSEGHNLWDGATRNAEDLRNQFIMSCPNSLKWDTAHDNGMGYASIVDKGFKYAFGAVNGGPLFIATMDYFAKLSGPGVIGKLAWHGTLANATITCKTAGYSVAIVGSDIILSLTGPVPKGFKNDVILTVTTPGFNPIDYLVRVSISARTGTAPAIVDMDGGFNILEEYPFWAATSRKFSAVFILQFTEDVGTGYSTIAGNSDGRIHYIFKSNGIEISRQASGNTVVRIQDAADTTLRAVNGTLGGNFKKDSGMRAVFISYDADQPSLCKAYLSAGKLISTGATQALQSTALTPANSGTLALNMVGSSAVLTSSALFTDGRPDNYRGATTFFQGRKGNVWIVNDFIDFGVAANRALFFNETTQLPVDLGNDAGTVLGITPTIYLPGDAAELWMGSQNAYDSDRGGATTKNHGNYGDLTAVYLGNATTL